MKPSPVLQPTYRDLTRDEIADALGFIDPNCARPEWARMGMAIKSELGPDGFDIWDKWSQTGENYDSKAARDTWKSISASGGINIGTMIAEAMQFGFKFNQDDRTPIGQDEIDRRARERKERDDAAKAEKTLKRAAAAMKANATWDAAQDIDGDDHPYLKRKGVLAHGVRVGAWKGQKDALLIPMRTIDGAIVSLQAISANPAPTVGRAKDFLFDGQMSGTMHWIGDIPNAATVVLVIAEGYATGASVHMASGYSVAVGFTAGNLRNVALALRAKFPQVIIIVAAENDKWNKTNAGMVGAQQACTAARAMLASPVFKDDATQPTDFNDLHQLEGIDAVRGQINSCLPRADNDNDADADAKPKVDLNGAVDHFRYPHSSDKFQPLNTVENLDYLFGEYGITARYNETRKNVELKLPGRTYSMDNRGNCALAELTSICVRNRMPQSMLSDYVKLIADRNAYNPVRDWIDSRPWDGVTRLDQLYATVSVSGDTGMRDMLLYRWLLSCVAAIYLPYGFESHGVLVFTGNQGQGKTKWVKSLVPPNMDVVLAGAVLDPNNKDTITVAVSHWLVELGELDATFRKADIARLKSFITNSVDKLRRPYDRVESEYQRRTVFFASVNKPKYLVDDTGNRRWWTVATVSVDYEHGIDMQQVWAELLVRFNNGDRWYLTAEEQQQLNAMNQEHEFTDPIEEQILTAFDWDKKGITNHEMTATEVLIAMGYDKPTKAQATEASEILRRLTGKDARRTAKGRYFQMPSAPRARNHCHGPRAYPDDKTDDRPW